MSHSVNQVYLTPFVCIELNRKVLRIDMRLVQLIVSGDRYNSVTLSSRVDIAILIDRKSTSVSHEFRLKRGTREVIE